MASPLRKIFLGVGNFVLIAVLLCLIGIALLAVLTGCGRTASRLAGKNHRQVLHVENFERFISISFDKRGDSTVKDVTFTATDGYVYTQEFKDSHVLEGVIRWVPHGQDSSLIQSRSISRWTGGAVNTSLPEDCVEVLGVDVSYKSKDERVKNLTYRSADGSIYSHEYLDGVVHRNFGGWLEVRPAE